MEEITNSKERTDAKLRYARLHLEELRAHQRKGSGDDFERSHQESFLFHLVSARDAFLQELNLYYGGGLKPREVTADKLTEKLKKMGVECPELDKLKRYENPECWLHVAKEMRNHSTHRDSMPRAFHVGGEDDGKVFLRNTQSRKLIKKDYADTFEEWCSKLENLLNDLRNTAVSRYQPNR
ncbi:MAG: hypothetical protein FFODKBPE_00397 [Candidatus Argoarchaeum ethanivorans]|uniref:Cthe-2314-like HEPN domain-containing protein n=1 Tax=Candidatus Argoarchaeum ethanivorans TaxID=2608793 RepID=A0A811T6F3_9EURY|nr:MAG: hypothetical protein FFODKBPE_00397 [Candidatus Argoarchaeum ethanivorans]